MLEDFSIHLGKRIGVENPLRTNRPHLYLTHAERQSDLPKRLGIDPSRPFVLIDPHLGGGWETKKMNLGMLAEVVLHFTGRVTFCQTGEGVERIKGAIDLVGRTHGRDLFILAQRSLTGISAVSFLYWIYCGLAKPVIVVDSAREQTNYWNIAGSTIDLTVRWRPYPSRCNQGLSCWRLQVRDVDDKRPPNRPCHEPVTIGEQRLSRCMSEIRSETVIAAIENLLLM